MRRLNVRDAQIDECIRSSMFALYQNPQNPPLQKGELLLLQLVQSDSSRQGSSNERIRFALIFDHIEQDLDGSISRFHWPNENRIWPWIVYGLGTIPTVPFSLDGLDLSRNYSGQTNALYIRPEDAAKIEKYILWSHAVTPQPFLQIVPSARIAEEFGESKALAAIFNHDRIQLIREPPVAKRVAERFVRNASLGDALKGYYDHRCQVCDHTFEPTYGVTYSESHHIQYLSEGGPDFSQNIVVLCPNHHRIIHETSARFEQSALTYAYPNGLREPLKRADHFLEFPDQLRDRIPFIGAGGPTRI